MEIKEYESNSFKSREEKKRESQEKRDVKQVASGAIRTRKRGVFSKFVDAIVTEDFSVVKTYILSDVIVPAIKKTIFDVICNSAEMSIYGESGVGRKRSSRDSKVSWRQYYDDDRSPRAAARVGRSTFDSESIEFESRGEAEAVLDELLYLIQRYGYARVMDFYQAAGLSCSNYTYNDFGWEDLEGATVTRSRYSDAYIIRMPRFSQLT